MTPSIVPAGHDQNIYLVLNNFGRHGMAFIETDPNCADFETTVADLISCQYSEPLRVVVFNTIEDRAADVSRDIASEIIRRIGLSGDDVPACLEGFIAEHYGPDRQLTLRLVDR